MQSEPTVILVDDDQSVRESLQWLIESVDLHVVTYGSAAEFLDSFDPLAPGCLVLDVRMPGMSGLELQENLAAHSCGLPVIIITGHADVPMSVRAFEGGAFAFLEKPVNQQVLLEKITTAIAHDRANRLQAVPADLDVRIARLTPREHEVMDLLVAGYPMKRIASELQISVPTCSKHRTKVLAKLEVDNDVRLALCVHGRSTPPPRT
jgi:two-component system, LuxR family, response regulator FixJ